MKKTIAFAAAAATSFSLVLAGCDNQSDEQQGIEDAIPLDNPEDTVEPETGTGEAGGGEAGGGDAGGDAGSAAGDTPALPGADGGSAMESGSGTTSAPMENGSNAAGETPPPGSKLQRADPEY